MTGATCTKKLQCKYVPALPSGDILDAEHMYTDDSDIQLYLDLFSGERSGERRH